MFWKKKSSFNSQVFLNGGFLWGIWKQEINFKRDHSKHQINVWLARYWGSKMQSLNKFILPQCNHSGHSRWDIWWWMCKNLCEVVWKMSWISEIKCSEKSPVHKQLETLIYVHYVWIQSMKPKCRYWWSY